MNIRFDCPFCNKLLQAPETKAGTRLVCSKCGQSVTVPPPLPRKGEVFTDEPAAPQKRRGRKLGTLAWAGIAVGGVLVLAVVIGAGLGLFGKKDSGGENNQAAAKTGSVADAQTGSKQAGGGTTEQKTPPPQKAQPPEKTPDTPTAPTSKNEPPIGTWLEERTEKAGDRIREFRPDGTLILHMPKSGQTFKGSWKWGQGKVYIKEDGTLPVPVEDKWFTIAASDERTMTILMMGTRRYVWTRSPRPLEVNLP